MAAVISAERNGNGPAGTSDRLRITPTRRRIDDRAPFLGFTITTGGLPFFEVLLDHRPRRCSLPPPRRDARPANVLREPAGRRTAAGPRRASGLHGPAGRVAARSRPGLSRCSAISYTVVGYATPDGGQPTVRPRPRAELADAGVLGRGRPRLHRPDTRRRCSGSTAERLVRHRPTAVVARGAASRRPTPAPAAPEIDAAADRAEGEDGTSRRLAPPATLPPRLPYDDGWGQLEPVAGAQGLEWSPSGDVPPFLLDSDERGRRALRNRVRGRRPRTPRSTPAAGDRRCRRPRDPSAQR